jgi:pilus assembly protein Flp/PilA
MGRPKCKDRREAFDPKEVGRMLFLPREEGQGLIEFALILVLVAIVVLVILAILGPQISDWVENVIEDLF